MKFTQFDIAATVIFLLMWAMTSCVQPTKKQTIHFSIDTRGVSGAETIGVRGSIPPLSWNQDFELNDNDQDSIFTGTLQVDIPYDYIQVKFVKNGSQFELENEPNRKIYFDQSLTTQYNAVFDQLEK